MHAPHRLARAALALTILASLTSLALAARQNDTRPRLEGLGGPSALALGGIGDVSDAGLAFVELVLERDTLLLREPFTLRLRFGFETGFLDANLIQLFQRELDVPAQLIAPWFEELAGASALARAEPAVGARVALGESVVRAQPTGERVLGGRSYRTFELERTFVPIRTGELVLAAPLLRFAHATRFEDDFVQGKRPLDRRDAFVRGRPARLVVRELPEDGRPPQFSGAIGRFTLQVEAQPRELAAGASLALTVRIEGAGPLDDLSSSEPPRLDDLAGFHVRGSLVEREPRRLTLRADLVPDGPEVHSVPPVRFAFFDTTPPAGYHVLASEPIAITVRAPERASVPPEAAAPAPASPRRLTLWLLPLALALGGLAWLVLRRRRGAPPA